MRTLVLGGTGLLGPYLQEVFSVDSDVVTVGRRRGVRQVDASDQSQIADLVADLRPDVVINCVACTDVDLCERDPALADALNRAPVDALVRAIEPKTQLVHLSTDQVYDGISAPFTEEGTNPINVYGRSKLAGERCAVTHKNTLILRVNFFGRSRTDERRSLSDWLTTGLTERREITLFTDSFFSPLRMTTLSNLTRRLVRDGLTGTYNLGSRDGASKAWFARRFAQEMGLPVDTATEGLSADIPGRAPRPRDMRMDVSKFENATGIALPTLAQEIQDHAAEELRAMP